MSKNLPSHKSTFLSNNPMPPIQSEHEIERLLSRAMQLAKLGDWIIDIPNLLIYLSEEHLKMIGLEPGEDEVRIMSLAEYGEQYIHKDDHAFMGQWLKKVEAENCETFFDKIEYRVIMADGTIRNMEVTVCGNANRNYISGMTQDITERKQIEETLKESEAFLRSVLHATTNYIVVVDREYQIKFFNKRTEDFIFNNYGYHLQVGESILKFIPPAERRQFRKKVLRTWKGEAIHFQQQYPVHGRELWFQYEYLPVTLDGKVIGTVLSHRDITLEKEHDAQNTHYAFHDALTGLPNRRRFQQTVEQSLEKARKNKVQAAMVIFDLDHFKFINDNFGHSVGDRLLQQIAHRLQDVVKPENSLSRLGGDEFIFILPKVEGVAEVQEMCRHVKQILDPPFEIDGRRMKITTSFGISLYPRDGKDIETLTKRADMAMYRAKASGRDAINIFNDRMHKQSMIWLDLGDKLKAALQEEQFELYFQPKYCLKNKLIYGVEALLRWHSPDMGLVTPEYFIPFAEESGFIQEIGEWVLRKALQTSKMWKVEDHLSPIISVNLSPRQFGDIHFPRKVREILRETGTEGNLLEFEITEGVIMKNLEKTQYMLSDLRDTGAWTSIDDFGMGFSSLNYLKYLSVDTLKIDKEFVKDVPDGPKDRAIVESIINLAHNLGMNVLAEGVENEKQLQFLVERDCDFIQGYYIGRPMTADDIAAFLQANREAGAGTPMSDHGPVRWGKVTDA